MNFNHTFSQMKREAKILLSGHWGAVVLGLIITTLFAAVLEGIFKMILMPNEDTVTFTAAAIYEIANIIIALIAVVLLAGFTRMILMVCRRKDVKATDVFALLSRRPDRYIFSSILVSIVTSLPVLPGIIVMFAAIADIFVSFALSQASNPNVTNSDITYIMQNAMNTGGTTLILVSVLLIFVGMIFSIILSLAYQYYIQILVDNEEMGIIEAMRTSRHMMKGYKGRLFLLQLSFIGWMILGIFTLGILYLWLVPYVETTLTLFYFDLKKEPVPDERIPDGQGDFQSTVKPETFESSESAGSNADFGSENE